MLNYPNILKAATEQEEEMSVESLMPQDISEYDPEFEALKAASNKDKLSKAHKDKCGEYLYHGTHRNLDIKYLGIHVCKNRANTDITAPCVYMTRSLGVACLNCVPFMIGHGSKLDDYEEHFANLEEAINADGEVTHVEIVHNDPELAECSGEREGYIYCVKKKDCINDLYYATPDDPNDWYFVAYRQLKIAEKRKVKITWHKKYDKAFAEKVKNGFMAVESFLESMDWKDVSASFEGFTTSNKFVAKRILDSPELTKEQFVKSLRVGDILVSYPKSIYRNTLARKIQGWLAERVLNMSFASAKLYLGNDTICGFNARMDGELKLTTISPKEFVTRASGVMILRPNVSDNAKKNAVKLILDYKDDSIDYSFKNVIKAVVVKLLHLPTSTDTTKMPSMHSWFCSSIIAHVYRLAGGDLNLNKNELYVLPNDLAAMQNAKCIGYHFNENQFTKKDKEALEKFANEELGSIPLDPNHKGPDRFKNDVWAIDEISDKHLNRDIITILMRYDDYLETLKHWCTVPDYTLVDKLQEFGQIIDQIYGFTKRIEAYRGIRTGNVSPHQNSMDLTDDTDGERVPKPDVKPGYSFMYMVGSPMSVSRSIWLSKIYGNLIVKCVIKPSVSKLIITNELAYVLQQLDKKYPDYRPINLSVMAEIIIFPGENLNFKVVTTTGDISSELPMFKEFNYATKKITPDALTKLGEEELRNFLTDPVNQSSYEALGETAITTKKKEILDYICAICDKIDPTQINSKRYQRMIGAMNAKEFDTWMNYVKDGKWQLHIVAPNMIVNLKNENILKAADFCNCKLFHRIWMDDLTTGRRYLTDNEYLVLQLPIRRQQQFLDEKISVPDDDRHIDGMTGQVTGDSKSCQISNPEIQILASRGLNAVLAEFVNVRGGNIAAYSEFKRQAEETGDITLNSLDPSTRSRTAVVAEMLLNSMMLETNII